MPELPEVETVRAGIAPWLEGATIINVKINNRAFRIPIPDQFEATLIGNIIESIHRRGKYLIFNLGAQGFIGHLGMSGSIRRLDLNEPERKHDHLILVSDKVSIAFNDPRRFGGWDLWRHDSNAHKWISNLGPEPLGNDFNAEILSQKLHKKSAPIKQCLLNQNLIAGIGNIYASEALWRAEISPLRLACELTANECEKLTSTIRSVLQDAIEAGGSTLRDHRNIEGELGYFQHRFDVYGRANEKCRRPDCDGIITKITQSARSSFFCAHCQY